MTICPTTGRKNRAGCHELRENAIVSSEHAAIDEKMQSFRRRSHSPARKRNFLVGTRPLRRESEIFSRECALSGEKLESSGRSARPRTRIWNHLVGARGLRRENGILSSVHAVSE